MAAHVKRRVANGGGSYDSKLGKWDEEHVAAHQVQSSKWGEGHKESGVRDTWL